MSAQVAAARRVAPFRGNAPRRLRRVGAVEFANARELNAVNAPQTGYLNGFWMSVSGTMNMAGGGGGALADEGPFNIIKKIVIESNEGATAHVNVSGYGLFAMNLVSNEKCFRADKAGIGDTTPDADIYAAGVANGNNSWQLWYYIPIALNRFMSRNAGLVDLSAREFQMKIKITTEDVANVISANLGTGFTGSIEFWYEHFQVPQHYVGNELAVEIPVFARVRTVEQIDAFTNPGQDVSIEFPHDGALTQVIHEVVINGVRSDAYDTIKWVYNDDSNPYEWDRRLLKLQNRSHYGVNMPTGVVCLDFFNSTQHVNDGDTPDLVDTTKIVLIESRIKIQDTAVLGVGNNFIRTVRRYIQRARVQQS